MGENYEQAMIRLGFDLSQVEAGTVRMLAIQENAQAKIRQAQAEDARYYKKLLADNAAENEAYTAKQIALAKEYQAESISIEAAAAKERTAILEAAAAERQVSRNIIITWAVTEWLNAHGSAPTEGER